MSNVTALSELAKFIGKSPLATGNLSERQAALRSLGESIAPRGTRQKVSDLIDIVMIRSARSRRQGRARVYIDLDVFAPDSTRAVDLIMRNI